MEQQTKQRKTPRLFTVYVSDTFHTAHDFHVFFEQIINKIQQIKWH